MSTDPIDLARAALQACDDLQLLYLGKGPLLTQEDEDRAHALAGGLAHPDNSDIVRHLRNVLAKLDTLEATLKESP